MLRGGAFFVDTVYNVHVGVGRQSVTSDVRDGEKSSDVDANADPELCVNRGLLLSIQCHFTATGYIFLIKS